MIFFPVAQRLLPPVQDIRLTDIDFDNDCFHLSFEPDLTKITQSMATMGLINPPILRGPHPYHIVSGYRRAAAARQLGWETIPVRIFQSQEISHKTALELAFFENVGTRTFNLIEAAVILTRFRNADTDSQSLQNKILPLMGFQPGKKVLHRLLSLTHLVRQWKSYVVHKGLALANAATIARFLPEDQTILFQALSPLKLGHNKMSQCLDMLEDIQKREAISLLTVLKTGDFHSILSNEQYTSSEKTTLFRRALRERRYPVFTGTEKQFQQARRKITLPPAVRLDPPPFFEGNRLILSGSFRSAEELRTIATALNAAAESEALGEMLAVL